MARLANATWGTQSRRQEVFIRINELMALGQEFFATPSDLQADPVPGLAKTLTLILSDGNVIHLNEGDCVSKVIAAVYREDKEISEQREIAKNNREYIVKAFVSKI